MELKDFIKESLLQIATGINEANESLKDVNAIVNPDGIQVYSEEAKAYGRINNKFIGKEPLVELIQFDVAVQVESGSKSGGGIKLAMAAINVGASGNTHDSTSTESRIQFQIPIVYPKQKNMENL